MFLIFLPFNNYKAMKTKLLSMILLAFIFVQCQNTDSKKETSTEDSLAQIDKALLEQAQKMFKVMPEMVEKDSTKITDAMINLGKMLYFDTRLSKKQTQSCNSCHNLATFGVDNLATSPGDNGTLGTRNSPTVFNAAIHKMQFWDGRAADVETQATMPILNPIEMGMSNEKEVLKRLAAVEGYKKLFAEAFPDDKTPITYTNVGKAIGAFERTLTTTDRFDKFLNGDLAALNAQEKKGLNTFISTGCTTCHIGPSVGGEMLMKFGLLADYAPLTGSKVVDEGKFAVTKNEADKFIFKSMGLRNIEKTHPYFHDGSVADLKQAIQIMAKTELGKELSQEEVDDIHAFLLSLTGEIAAEKITPPVLF